MVGKETGSRVPLTEAKVSDLADHDCSRALICEPSEDSQKQRMLKVFTVGEKSDLLSNHSLDLPIFEGAGTSTQTVPSVDVPKETI